MKQTPEDRRTEEWRLLLKNKIIIIISICLYIKISYASGFLGIIPVPGSLGMGGVNNGISSGISSLFLNPAGLIHTEGYEFVYSHLFWPIAGLDFSDDLSVKYEYFGFAGKEKKSAHGINFAHYHQPDLVEKGIFYPIYSGFVSATYAYDFYYLLAGIRIRALWEFLGPFKSRAFALDFGISRSFDLLRLYKGTIPNITTGISFYNIGSSLALDKEEEPLPANMQLGYSYIFFKNYVGTLLFANDYKYSFGYGRMYRFLEINSGLEYSLKKYLSLRAGYMFSIPVFAPSHTHMINNKFSYGIGVHFKISSFRFRMEYSLLIPVLETKFYTHSTSLGVSKLEYEEQYIE